MSDWTPPSGTSYRDTVKSSQKGGVPNQVSEIKEKVTSIRKKIENGEYGKEEAAKKISEVSDDMTSLLENDVQGSLVESINGLKRYLNNLE